MEVGRDRGERGKGRGQGYLEMVAFVLVGDEVCAREGDLVGEGGGVPIDVIAVAEHLRAKILAAFFERVHCEQRHVKKPKTSHSSLENKGVKGKGFVILAFWILAFRTAFLARLALAVA